MISEVYNCDCMEYMNTIPDNFADLAICDPPYGIGVGNMAYTQEDNRQCKQKNGGSLKVKKEKYKLKDWDKKPPTQEYFNELFRTSKNQIIFGINYFNLENIGKGRIKWNKCVPEGMSFNKYEHAYCSLIDYEQEFVYLWAGMCQAKNLKETTTQQGNKKLNEKRIHPCHKPVNLYKWILHNYAKTGDKIFDSHMGSQSSRIAAYDMGFDFWGTELDHEYFETANKRFETHIAQQTMKF
jgi:site-specific DNA-methyltransferase (adenine-specific)